MPVRANAIRLHCPLPPPSDPLSSHPTRQIFLLQLQAELEGVRSIATQGEEMQYTVDFQQSGGTETKTGVVLSADEMVEVGNGSTNAHAVLRWGGKTQSTITMVPLKGVTRDVTAEDSGQMVALAALECREPPCPRAPPPPAPWPAPGPCLSPPLDPIS